MSTESREVIERIAAGRTDLVTELQALPRFQRAPEAPWLVLAR